MENNVRREPLYMCAICNKPYTELKDRISCETKCLAKQQEEAKKAAEAKKLAEKAADKAKVDEAFALAYKLRGEYVKKHGVYTYVHNEPVTNNINDLPTFGDVLDFLNNLQM